MEREMDVNWEKIWKDMEMNDLKWRDNDCGGCSDQCGD